MTKVGKVDKKALREDIKNKIGRTTYDFLPAWLISERWEVQREEV